MMTQCMQINYSKKAFRTYLEILRLRKFKLVDIKEKLTDFFRRENILIQKTNFSDASNFFPIIQISRKIIHKIKTSLCAKSTEI